ncbi:HlyD family efflux transporter periplasmic adaptor subunit [Candidatus Poribacteria bacterium]|nr:HlyD family efflux transporter periplasmic adaptor subunit [Candidatus Poribacteria bacterium]
MKKLPSYIAFTIFLFITVVYIYAQVAETGEKNTTHLGHDHDIDNSIESHSEHGVVPVVDKETKEILYWTCVMHPSVRMNEPGLCPVCNMDLIPVYAGEGLTLTPEQKALIPIKTERIGYRKLEREIRTVGVMDYNETKIAYASTRVSGWIQKLYVNFTGTSVKKGQRLLDIYSPELLVAQEEFLLAVKNLQKLNGSQIETVKQTLEQTLQAAESRLELLGLTKQQIQDIREHGKVRTELPLYSPISGTVVHLNVYKGQYMNRGTHLYRIADLSNLWLLADIYEYEMPWVSVGQDVIITIQSMPGKEFHGSVIFIYPYMDNKTRTVKIQVEVPNPDGELRPGMYATVRVKSTLAQIYSQKPKHTHQHEMTQPVAAGSESATVWTCPMHPQIKRDEPGECPICGMDLVELVEEVIAEKPDIVPQPVVDKVWTCPMHPQIIRDEPGECPICGMDLIEEEKQPESATTGFKLRSDAPPLQFAYICPDHPDKLYDMPGKCPEDSKERQLAEDVLAVPKSAVINTGTRTVVFVDKGEAGYDQVEVTLGPEAWVEENGTRRRYFPIIRGLFAENIVVTNGNYLLDSQTQLTGSAAGAYGGALGKDDENSPTPAHQH